MCTKILIVLLLLCSLYGLEPQSISLAELQISEQHYSTQIDYFANLYGTDSSVVKKVIQCESQGLHSSIGDGGRSKGIAQFQKPTWDWLESIYNKEYKEDLNYKSSFDQIKLLTYSISKGYGERWTTYVAIQKGGTYSFYSSQLKKHFTITCR